MEDMLKIIEEVNNKKIDVKKTIEKAAEFKGEKGVAIFQNKPAPIDYDVFAQKRNYKFDFLSDRFYSIMDKYYISNKGIFIVLAKSVDILEDISSIETLSNKIDFSFDEYYSVANYWGIKLTKVGEEYNIEFGCTFGAIACGYGGVWVYNTISDKFRRVENNNSLENKVNQIAIKMVADEIVFEK